MALVTALTPPPLRILALCASFNRKSKTLAALTSLASQVPEQVSLQLAIVDDNSSDGTLDAVRQAFPSALVINAGGHCYWAGAMRIGFARFWHSGRYTHLLVFNDDCVFHGHALSTLTQVATSQRGASEQGVVVAGSMKDPDSGHLTYGGLNKRKWWPSVYFQPVTPHPSEAQAIDTLNMNLALIDAQALQRVELIGPHFVHGFADFDFGLRAKQESVAVLLAPGFLGECARNTVANTWQDTTLPFSQRREMLFQAKGLPTRPRKFYLRRHAPLAWPVIFVWPYLKFYASWIAHSFKRD